MRKSDGQLQRDVQDELQWEPSLDAAGIGVAVRDGVVTLSGHVRSYGGRLAAERATKRILGVKALADDLEVRLPTSSVRDDTDLAEAVVRALKWSVAVPEDRVRATVSRGIVTLEGVVPLDYQRRAAFQAVREITGVVGVLNQITLEPGASPAEIRRQVESAFERSARIEAQRVNVETDGGKVTLRGTVRSWAEYDESAVAAWAAPGVTSVLNLLTVEAEAPVLA